MRMKEEDTQPCWLKALKSATQGVSKGNAVYVFERAHLMRFEEEQ